MTSQIYDAKEHIGDVLPSCKVFLSAPVLRLDNGKAGLTLKNLITKMKGINNVILMTILTEVAVVERLYI